MLRRAWCLFAGYALLLLAIGCRTSPPGVGKAPDHGPPSLQVDGRFLAISDFHFDPFQGLSRAQFAALAAASLDEWPARLAEQPAPHYGADSPFALVQSSLDDAQRRLPEPDFIFVLGDFLAHDWAKKYDQLAAESHLQNPVAYRAFTRQVMQFLATRVKQAFPKAPVLPVLGNDDSDCGDYRIAPDSAFLKMFAEVWAPLVFPEREVTATGLPAQPSALLPSRAGSTGQHEFAETVARGGNYSISLPTLSHHRLIALNTVFWTPQYTNACDRPEATPALDQFRWLEATLARAENQGEPVWLMMHLPPGIDGYETYRAHGIPRPLWTPAMTERFLQLVRRYQKTIQLTFAGHTHRDDFRVIQLEKRPTLLTKIVPSISPIYGNNPGYQIFHYARPSGTVTNYIAYVLPLAPSAKTPTWSLEYEFASAYPTLQFDPLSLARLGAEVLAGGQVQQSFRQYYSVSGPPTPIPNSILGCAILHATTNGFAECTASLAGTRSP